MTLLDRVIEFEMTVVLIIGGYQFYFWAQRRRWFTKQHYVVDVVPGAVLGMLVFWCWSAVTP